MAQTDSNATWYASPDVAAACLRGVALTLASGRPLTADERQDFARDVRGASVLLDQAADRMDREAKP